MIFGTSHRDNLTFAAIFLWVGMVIYTLEAFAAVPAGGPIELSSIAIALAHLAVGFEVWFARKALPQ